MSKEIHIVFKVLNFIHSFQSEKYKLNDAEKSVLINLASHKGAKGIFPKITTIAKEVKKGYSTVKRLLTSLNKKDLITIDHKLGKYSNYYINLDIINNEKLSTSELTCEPCAIQNEPSTYPQVSSLASPTQLTDELGIYIKNKKKREREGRTAENSNANSLSIPPSEIDFKRPKFEMWEASVCTAENIEYARKNGSDLAAQLEAFKQRWRGRRTAYEFKRWLDMDISYRASKGSLRPFKEIGQNISRYGHLKDWTAERLKRENLENSDN